MNRRDFAMILGGGVLLSTAGVSYGLLIGSDDKVIYLRPPGALGGEDFLSACVRCGQCSAVCPRSCVSTHPLTSGPAFAGVPFIDPRKRACNLCMKCTEVCPTNALSPIPDDKETIAATVSMGVAVIDKSTCISFLGRMCGLCRDACPYPGKAIKLEPWARPVVFEKHCVGCGLCVEVCPQQPSAILVDPKRRRNV